MLLSFISHFVIDFLSISKVIIIFVIATDDRHPYGSVYQNAALYLVIHFSYIAQPGGGGGGGVGILTVE